VNFKTITLVVLAVLAATLFFVLQKHTPPADPVSINEVPDTDLQMKSDRRPAADFTLTDLNGKDVRLADFRGSVVLMIFWTTW